MAGVELRAYNNNAVITEVTKPWRWLAAFGPSVTKWELNPADLPLASTTSLPGYTHTAMTSGNMTLTAGAAGGELVITAGAGDNQGGQIQGLSEAFTFAAAYPTYFGASIAVNDADQTDVFVGLAITDTSILDGVTDSIGFRSVDESAVISGMTEKNNVESVIAAGTLLDDTYMIVEFYSDGKTLHFYVNGSEVASQAVSVATMPNDEFLAPTIAFLTGEATANTLGVKWAKAFQIRETA